MARNDVRSDPAHVMHDEIVCSRFHRVELVDSHDASALGAVPRPLSESGTVPHQTLR